MPRTPIRGAGHAFCLWCTYGREGLDHVNVPDDAARDELPEQVESTSDDPGGMPYDDDLDADAERPVHAWRTRLRLAEVADRPQHRLSGRGTDRDAGAAPIRAVAWGGADLGILAKPPRAVRAGDTPSLHNWGMAWDWRWQDPGPGRQVADEVIEFCLTNAERLGIQAVHDYQGTRFWKSYAGWRPGTPNPNTGMGQPWAQWLHIERTWHSANLATSIEALLGGGSAAAPADTARVQVPTSPPDSDGTQQTVLPAGPLRRGSVGADVGRLQDFLRQFGFAEFSRSDGVFGPRTEAAVIKAQQALTEKSLYTAEIDGIWGPKTHAAATQLLADLGQ